MNSSDIDLQVMSAFPKALRDDALRVLSVLPAPFHICSDALRTVVGDEVLLIPYRVFYEKEPSNLDVLTFSQRVLLDCLFTRHHDGRVREDHLTRIIGCRESWVPPFVIQLIGEYVIEIIAQIHKNIGLLDSDVYSAFLRENGAFWERTKQRVVSYWDCYYRRTWKRREDYVGFQIVDHLDALLTRTA